MQTRDALHRIAYELAEDAARENVRYLEVRYGPILHTEAGLTMWQVKRRRARRAPRRRARPRRADGRDRVRAPRPVRERVARAGPSSRRPTATRASSGSTWRAASGGTRPRCTGRRSTSPRKELLNITVHAGESFGPASIRQALFKCGAHRIGHGVTLGQDPALLRYVVDRQVPLEVCPTSNVQTHVVASYEAHPVAEYVRAGVPVTINTDNRLFSHTTVTDELWLAHTRCGIPAEALREIVLNGFRHAFLPHPEKVALLDEVEPLVALPQSA